MGFGVWGLGFGVWGLEFGVLGLRFGVWGEGFRVRKHVSLERVGVVRTCSRAESHFSRQKKRVMEMYWKQSVWLYSTLDQVFCRCIDEVQLLDVPSRTW